MRWPSPSQPSLWDDPPLPRELPVLPALALQQTVWPSAPLRVSWLCIQCMWTHRRWLISYYWLIQTALHWSHSIFICCLHIIYPNYWRVKTVPGISHLFFHPSPFETAFQSKWAKFSKYYHQHGYETSCLVHAVDIFFSSNLQMILEYYWVVNVFSWLAKWRCMVKWSSKFWMLNYPLGMEGTTMMTAARAGVKELI